MILSAAVLLAVMAALTSVAGIEWRSAVVQRQAAVSQRDIANRQHAIALARQLAAESLTTDQTDPLTARQLAVVAWCVYPTSQADSAMETFLAEQEKDGLLPATSDSRFVNGVAFSPDGKLLASADNDGTVGLWKLSLFTNPYAWLRADVGLPARQQWNQYAPSETFPKDLHLNRLCNGVGAAATCQRRRCPGQARHRREGSR